MKIGQYKNLELLNKDGERFSFSGINFSLPDYQFNSREEFLWRGRGEFNPSKTYPLPFKRPVKKYDFWTATGIFYNSDCPPPINSLDNDFKLSDITEQVMQESCNLENFEEYAVIGEVRIQALVNNPDRKRIEDWLFTQNNSPEEYLLDIIRKNDTKTAQKKLVSFFENFFLESPWSRDQMISRLRDQISDLSFFIKFCIKNGDKYPYDLLSSQERKEISELNYEWDIFLKNQLVDLGQTNPNHLSQWIKEEEKEEAEILSRGMWHNNIWTGNKTEFIKFLADLFDEGMLKTFGKRKLTASGLSKICDAHYFPDVIQQTIGKYTVKKKDRKK